MRKVEINIFLEMEKLNAFCLSLTSVNEYLTDSIMSVMIFKDKEAEMNWTEERTVNKRFSHIQLTMSILFYKHLHICAFPEPYINLNLFPALNHLSHSDNNLNESAPEKTSWRLSSKALIGPHRTRSTIAQSYNTQTCSLSVPLLLLAARLTKGQFKAKCSRRRLNKPPESPRARGLLGKLSTHTQTSDRLTAVIESPFASRSFHHRPNRPRHAAASRTDVCVDQTHWRQVVSVCEGENVSEFISLWVLKKDSVFIAVCMHECTCCVDAQSVWKMQHEQSWILLTLPGCMNP